MCVSGSHGGHGVLGGGGGSIGQRLVGLAVVFVLVPGLNGVHWPSPCLCACIVGRNDDRQLIKFDSGYCGTRLLIGRTS